MTPQYITPGYMKLSEASKNPAISTLDNMGGIGYGYLVGDLVYVSCGNGFACHDKSVTHYICDGGIAYRKAFKGFTPEQFKAIATRV